MKEVSNVLLVLTLLALSLALPSAGVTRVSQIYAETDPPIAGWFTVIWGDGKPGSGANDQVYVLAQDDGQSIELLLSEELLQPLGGVLALNQKRVIVEGQWARTAALHVRSIRLDTQFPDTAAISPQVSGSQPWLSIMCKFSDVSAESRALSYFQDMYDSSYPGLDHYWRELSFGAINIQNSGAVGWYTLPQPWSYYVYDMDGDGSKELNRKRAADDCTAVADADVYFPNYVGINLMFNDFLGAGWGGSMYMTLDGVTKLWRFTWEPPWGYEDIGVIEHEMGHSFGLPHSSRAYGYVYDNVWDVMSDNWSNCTQDSYHDQADPVYGCMGQHTISYHKDLLGWIPAGRKFTATSGTQTQITLEQLALPQTSNYLVAQIPIQGAADNFYTVEARRLTGYDSHNPVPGQAVVIHEVDTGRSRPAYVVDSDGDPDTVVEREMWLPGEMFTDAANGVRVCVNAATATGFVVTIGLGVVIDCPLEADLSSSTLHANPVTPAAGQSITYTTHLVNWGGATALSVTVTSTIPNNTTFIPGSAWTSQGTATGSGPVVFNVGDMAYDAPVTVTFGVTVSAQITQPTVLTGTVIIGWKNGSLVREHFAIVNAETAHLPFILAAYRKGD
jgi:uncharacterized repeat protein (TIGR01451 family)